MVCIAGIDPGIKHIGVAVIDITNCELVAVKTYGPKENRISDSLSFYEPVLIGIEEPFAGKNIRDYGNTKEVIGLIIGELAISGVITDPSQIIRTSPAAGNTQLGLVRGGKKTDAIKREAAKRLLNTDRITDGHQASAVAAAMVAWDKYIAEVSKDV